MVCDDTCELLLTRKAHRSLAVQSFYWGSTTEAHQFTRLISGSILLPLQAGHKASVLFLVWPAPTLNHIVGFRYEGTQNIYFLRTPLKKTTGFCAPAELGNRPKRKRVCCDKLKKKKKATNPLQFLLFVPYSRNQATSCLVLASRMWQKCRTLSKCGSRETQQCLLPRWELCQYCVHESELASWGEEHVETMATTVIMTRAPAEPGQTRRTTCLTHEIIRNN